MLKRLSLDGGMSIVLHGWRLCRVGLIQMLTTSHACVYRVIEVRRSRNVYKREIFFATGAMLLFCNVWIVLYTNKSYWIKMKCKMWNRRLLLISSDAYD